MCILLQQQLTGNRVVPDSGFLGVFPPKAKELKVFKHGNALSGGNVATAVNRALVDLHEDLAQAENAISIGGLQRHGELVNVTIMAEEGLVHRYLLVGEPTSEVGAGLLFRQNLFKEDNRSL